jgi:membrane associated rhomboid family serine protease
MFLPIRAKNPPESVPYATCGLILANVVFYALTTNGLVVREAAVQQYALTRANMGPQTLLSSMFLHGDLLHLVGNMWFLALFGFAVEGRLRPLRFIVLYFLSGLCGDLLQTTLLAHLEDIPSLGASGAVMGVMGAALWMFPFSRVTVFYFFFPYGIGTWEWRMWAVAVYYLLFDTLGAFLTLASGLSGGVGNLAHLGGAAGGFLLAILLRGKRDDADVGEAKSVLSEGEGDLRILTRGQLADLAKAEPNNPKVALAWMQSGLHDGRAPLPECLEMVQRLWPQILREGDPKVLSEVALALALRPDVLSARQMMDAALLVEKAGHPQVALSLLDRSRSAPGSTDGDQENAVYRMALINEAWFQNHTQALALLEEHAARWPMSPMAGQVAERLRVVRAKVPPAV